MYEHINTKRWKNRKENKYKISMYLRYIQKGGTSRYAMNVHY